MPAGSGPTSTLPAGSQPPSGLEIVERAFAAAEVVHPLSPPQPVPTVPARGLLRSAAARVGAVMTALEGWLQPRCPSCGARDSVTLELRAAADGRSPHLWERCHACEESWASVRCADFSSYC